MPATGEFSIEITDAPIDDAEVKAVFVTVAGIRLNGAEIDGFNRTSVELSALTEGRTQTLYTGQVRAASYSSVDLILDDAIVDGEPGCYVLNQDGEKVALEAAGEGLISLQNSAFRVERNSAVRAVADFDLRKALVRSNDNAPSYQFAGQSRLNTSVRMVQRDSTGTLSGRVTNTTGEDGTVIVYAYAQGTYDDQEAKGAEADQFLGAVSSTELQANGAYTLAFLRAGNYELVAVAYRDTNDDGRTEMQGTFKLSAVAGINVRAIGVSANGTTTADLTLTALLN